MRDIVKIVFIGALAVLVFDAVAAVLSLTYGPAYGWFSIGSFLLYLLFGYLVARRSKWFSGSVAGAFLGLIESTLGWAISWYIGPGKVSMEMNPVLIVATIIFVVGVAAVLGLIGGALSLLKRSDA
jgi:hypothetical protein